MPSHGNIVNVSSNLTYDFWDTFHVSVVSKVSCNIDIITILPNPV